MENEVENGIESGEEEPKPFLESIWTKHYKKVILTTFWILGFTNALSFLVMLHSSNEFMELENSSLIKELLKKTQDLYNCQNITSSLVLLANILPAIIVKLIVPFFIDKLEYWQRAVIVIALSVVSYSLVVFGRHNAYVLFSGLILISLGASFGEITFLSLSTLYPTKQSLYGWSSGTGAGSLFGVLLYVFLTIIGVIHETIGFFMLAIPGLMICGCLFLPPADFAEENEAEIIEKDEYLKEFYGEVEEIEEGQEEEKEESFNILLKLAYIVPLLLIYMLPLFVTYYAEYVINQGLYSLLYFKTGTSLSHGSQIQFYNILFRIGGFIARSSLFFFTTKFIYIFPILQLINFGVLFLQVLYGFISSIWIVFGIVLWQGLVGGLAYANVYNAISTRVQKSRREFSISFTTLSDSVGILLSIFTALPTQNALCSIKAR